VLCGVGIDLFDSSRLERELACDGARLLGALYSPDEVATCLRGRSSVARLAACFAAKEAVAKALELDGSLGLAWRSIEVLLDRPGGVEVRLHGAIAEQARRRGVRRFRISLARSQALVVAGAVSET